MEKVLGPDGSPVMNDRGKPKLRKRNPRLVPFTYPVVEVSDTTEDAVEEIAIALMDVLKAQQAGYERPDQLLECINNGLYSWQRNALARGVDLRRTAMQRMSIRNIGVLVRDSGFKRELAVTALKSLGIDDAEAALELFLQTGDEEDSTP